MNCVLRSGAASRFSANAMPYIWKALGTNCRNLPQVHKLVRMEIAARMLKAGTASVEDIALETGFSDRTSFYRAFGATPTEYRQRNGTEG